MNAISKAWSQVRFAEESAYRDMVGGLAWVLQAAGPLGDRNGCWWEMDGLRASVLQSVKKVNASPLVRVGPVGAGIAFESRTLLTLLTYCYASGIYCSQDIEYLMGEDRGFRRLCRDEFPRWQDIRRFRRYNCHAIEQCLAEVLEEFLFDVSSDGSGSAMPDPGLDQFGREATSRIETAKIIDLMSEED